MVTGYHAALNAEVRPGYTVAVIGDSAVGLAGVIGAKLLGAEKIILLSHNDDCAQLGKKFGAIDIVSMRDEKAIKVEWVYHMQNLSQTNYYGRIQVCVVVLLL